MLSLCSSFRDNIIYAFLLGQLRFWNPDDLKASQSGSLAPQDWIEEKLQEVCEDLGITRDGHLNRKKLVSICEQYGLQNVDGEVSIALYFYSGIVILIQANLATGWKQPCFGFLQQVTETPCSFFPGKSAVTFQSLRPLYLSREKKKTDNS